MNPEIERKLRSLRLSGMALALAARNQEPIHHQLAYTDFLELLVEDELVRRRDRLFSRRFKQAGIPEVKTLEGFDYLKETQTLQPSRQEALIIHFIYRRVIETNSPCTVANEANAQGYRTKVGTFGRRDGSQRKVGGKRFDEDMVTAIIRNP